MPVASSSVCSSVNAGSSASSSSSSSLSCSPSSLDSPDVRSPLSNRYNQTLSIRWSESLTLAVFGFLNIEQCGVMSEVIGECECDDDRTSASTASALLSPSYLYPILA